MVTRKMCTVILPLIAALCFVTPVAAQQGSDGAANAFVHNGIKVIISPAQNELISLVVGLEGGMVDGETDNPALGVFTSNVIAGSGAATYPKSELRRFLSRTSTRISGGGDLMGIRFEMTATKSRFNEAWNVLSEMLRQPAFDETEFKNYKQRRITQAQGAWSSPDGHAYRIADSLMKFEHPYLGRYQYEKDIEAITLPMLRAYYKKLAERSRMVVVVVGNVSREEMIEKLDDFSTLPEGSYRRPELLSISTPVRPTTSVIHKENSPTTYIYAAFRGAELTDNDYWPLAVGMSFLRGRLFEEIRTKRNLSYAPGAWLGSSHGKGMGVLSVSTVWPDSAISIMYKELQKMRDGEFDAKDLEDAKQVYITRYYMREMTNARKCLTMYYNERYTGDWRNAFSYDKIAQVDKGAVQKAFKKYAHHFQVGIVGNGDAVTTARFNYADEVPGTDG